jgi:NAD(P)-dependent dehydrogenase (short-subunit alcohol dehydrogenase family)
MIPSPEYDKDKVAIITGASQGIGAGLTKVRPVGDRRDPAYRRRPKRGTLTACGASLRAASTLA